MHAYKATRRELFQLTTQQVVPLLLPLFFAFADNFNSYWPAGRARPSLCEGCRASFGSMEYLVPVCTQCYSSYYCSVGCRDAKWRSGGHKAGCDVLRDPDIRGMLTIDWSSFEDPITFPLPQ